MDRLNLDNNKTFQNDYDETQNKINIEEINELNKLIDNNKMDFSDVSEYFNESENIENKDINLVNKKEFKNNRIK